MHTPDYSPFPSLNASICSDVPNCLRISCNTSPCSSLFLDEKSFYVDIDFGFHEDGVRSHAKKKNNKKAAPSKNPFDEPEKPPEPPAEPPPPADNGGGDPPADGGSGGGGDGGDGGDEKKDDDWGDGWGAATDKKKKKKGKKAEEEEAERKKKEEEEEAERKKKEEEEAAAAAAAAATSAAADLSWADGNGAAPAEEDGWGSFATAGKKKKGKKGKVRHFACVNTTFQCANSTIGGRTCSTSTS